MANMGDCKKRAVRTRPEQQRVLLEYIEQHPEIMINSFTCPEARRTYNDNWRLLTETLNAIGYGAKTIEQWQRVLVDWVSKIKIKCLNIKKDIHGTGRGPGSRTTLSEIEQRLMALKGWSCIDGDGSTEEFGLVNQKKQCSYPVNLFKTASVVLGTDTVGINSNSSVSTSLFGTNSLTTTSKEHNKPPTTVLDSTIISHVEDHDYFETNANLDIELEINTTDIALQNISKRKASVEKMNQNEVNRKKRKTGSAGTTVSILQKQYDETITVLNKINNNISRIGDALESILGKL